MTQLALFGPGEGPQQTAAPARLTVGSVCTGYGGVELGLRLAGIDIQLAYVADPDPDASAVLAQQHPDVPNLGDIRTVDWADAAPVDLFCAGFPCQGNSLAGKRRGIDDERWLFDAICDAVRDMGGARPRMLLLENVRGLLSVNRGQAMARVLEGLARLGYVGRYRVVRASEAGAAHERKRVFILAWLADTPSPRLETRWQGRTGASTDGTLRLLKTPTAQLAINGGSQHPDKRRAGGHGPTLADEVEHLLPTPRATDGTNGGPNQRGRRGDVALPAAVQPERWGVYAEAVARQEVAFRRPAPDATEPSPRGGERISPRFVEWLMGLEPGYVTDVPGLTRNARMRVLGNGVVPQQLAHAVTLMTADTQ